ncbi:NifB/NifX family molybdenum-iron cluster-binding protein [Actinomyces sp. MRS3W]|uniref:NifB/NifX family molybdenum-iron cluster-binding protein n=1 Tax=Actinomyces sp. MRS3W TaxID=2800796 RepID=UPI0028FD2A5A|nr:NifB/NifX family molybdenum-iron cluster-binding protein [Actinomyces sp. MRS3W]MDU0349378.1 NifB/NifX family molybdenum-iron cluster-binding protein [Actinomyces sp. MRS3W]
MTETTSASTAVVLVPVTADGMVGPRFGRAPRVAVARVNDGALVSWEEEAVGWDTAHDLGTEGAHHARIVRFLRDHEVDTIVATHMGVGMQRVVSRMGIRLLGTAGGDARTAVLTALATAAAEGTDRRR